jgi:hypothetical protein
MVKRLDARDSSAVEIVARLRRRGGYLSAEVRDSARRIVEALEAFGPQVERLARLEGFANHAESVGTWLRRG